MEGKDCAFGTQGKYKIRYLQAHAHTTPFATR